MRPVVPVLAMLALATAIGCDDPKPTASASTASASTSAAPEAPKPPSMPNLLVDAQGPYIGIDRVRMKEPKAQEKLEKLIKALPLQGKPSVTLLVEKKAKIPDVAAVVTELGKAGAPKVLLKTDGRNDVPKELEITPEPRISSPAPCSVATMVMKDLATAVWPIRGGTARKHSKGMAGPDLSNTGEQLKKDIAACESNVAFFSADEDVEWESAYNLAGTVVNSDEKKKIDTLVLLSEIPVAGRPVSINK